MTDIMQELANVARKNKFSSAFNLSETDIVSVWDCVSEYISKQMQLGKGVLITNLGTFTFIQKKLDVGNNKYLLLQRPIFQISEKFSQTHALHANKYHLTGAVINTPLNYSALAFETPFDRDTVESCVKQVLIAMQRSIAGGKNVEFLFNGLGRLQIRERKVKMKFFKEFVSSVDGSGSKQLVVESMKNRPGTCDSVVSNRPPTRPFSNNTITLPKIQPDNNNKMMPTINENEEEAEETTFEENKEINLKKEMEEVDKLLDKIENGEETPNDRTQTDEILKSPNTANNRPEPTDQLEKATGKRSSASRMSFQLPKACAVTFDDDDDNDERSKLPPVNTSRQLTPPKTASELFLTRSQSAVELKANNRMQLIEDSSNKIPSPPPQQQQQQQQPVSAPVSACGHRNAGQELCYLCHQRKRRNIPVYFGDERKRRDKEEERVLDEYHKLKVTEHLLKEQERALERRHNQQKDAAFNLGVSQAIKSRKENRSFFPSYIFKQRPLTPPKFIAQNRYNGELARQVAVKEEVNKRREEDEAFMGRLEQVQLAEDLAIQRSEYLKMRSDKKQQYKNALDTQLQYKPAEIPAAFSDSQMFGKEDMTNEKLSEKRRRAIELYTSQRQVVEERKRNKLLNRLTEQRLEEGMLERSKRDMKEDLASRYSRSVENRKWLEGEWMAAVEEKKRREEEERRADKLEAGELVHESCDKYDRCGQCKRRLNNAGESNIWRESRYVPGARIMV